MVEMSTDFKQRRQYALLLLVVSQLSQCRYAGTCSQRSLKAHLPIVKTIWLPEASQTFNSGYHARQDEIDFDLNSTYTVGSNSFDFRHAQNGR